MAQHAALLEQVKAAFQEEMAKVHARLDALEGEVAQLCDRLSSPDPKASVAPPDVKASMTPKRGTRTKPPADAVVEDVELPAQD